MQKLLTFCTGLHRSLMMRKQSTAQIISLVLLLNTSVAVGQVIRNQLPLVTQTSAVSDRLYSSIILDLQENEYERALANIQRLRTEHSGNLVSVADRRQMEASLLADLLRTRIPDQREAARLLAEDEQLDSFALWRANLNRENAVGQLLDRGDRAWQQGAIDEAQQAWRLADRFAAKQSLNNLKDEPLDKSLPLEFFKRKIVSAILTGNFRTAQQELQTLHEIYPQAQGQVAGQTGHLYEILSRMAESLEDAEREEFLQTQDALPHEQVRIELLKKCWTVKTDTNAQNQTKINPVVWKNVMILQDRSGVRALDLNTGLSAWPAGEDDAGYIFETQPMTKAKIELPVVSSGGVISEETWIGRTGIATFTGGQGVNPSQMSRITALNLNSEGRLQWTVTPKEISDQDSVGERIFSGNPIVSRNRVFLPLRSASPGNRLQLLCLSAIDGTELWVRNVAASLKVKQEPTQNDDDRLIIEGETIYWLADGVAVCSLNAEDGALHWVSAVEPVNSSVEQFLSRNGEEQIDRDTLYFTNVNGVTAMDKFTGEILWEQYISPAPSLLPGIVDDLVIVTTPGIYAIHSQSGTLVWSHQSQTAQSRIQQGALRGRSLFWPTIAGLFTIDVLTGKIVQRDLTLSSIQEPLQSLGLHGSKIVVQFANQVVGIELD